MNKILMFIALIVFGIDGCLPRTTNDVPNDVRDVSGQELPFAPIATVSIPADHARVVDGDTIGASKFTIRLQGIDCPERFSDEGKAATRAMRSLIEGEQITCHMDGTLGGSRPVGICGTDAHPDLGQPMVAGGYCRDCLAFSAGRYADLETSSAAGLPIGDYCAPE